MKISVSSKKEEENAVSPSPNRRMRREISFSSFKEDVLSLKKGGNWVFLSPGRRMIREIVFALKREKISSSLKEEEIFLILGL